MRPCYEFSIPVVLEKVGLWIDNFVLMEIPLSAIPQSMESNCKARQLSQSNKETGYSNLKAFYDESIMIISYQSISYEFQGDECLRRLDIPDGRTSNFKEYSNILPS